MALLLSMTLVIAQEEETRVVLNVDLEPGSLEAGIPGSPALAFIQGVAPTTSRRFYAFTGARDLPPSRIGEHCEVGEFINAIACQTSALNGCTRIFMDDYKKEHANDLIPMSNWYTASWFKTKIIDGGYKYFGYQCKHPLEEQKAPSTPSTPSTSTQKCPVWVCPWEYPEDHLGGGANKVSGGGGKFTGPISYKKEVTGGESITIRGQWRATHSGNVALEAHVHVDSRTPLAVLTGDRSLVDGSRYWAGAEFDAVAGRTYSFALTVRTPSESGKYDVQVYSLTHPDGSIGVRSDIVIDRQGLTVTQDRCGIGGALNTIGRTLVRQPWNVYSTGFRQILTQYDCTVRDLEAFCGTVDSDGDGIPDKCDYCPEDKGIIQPAMGCHPCYGMSINSQETRDCYRRNHEEFGTPARWYPIMNPIVEQRSVCSGDRVVHQNIREWGDIETVRTVSCDRGQECEEIGNRAVCKDPAIQALSVESRTLECKDGDVYLITELSDGSIEEQFREECFENCYRGQCVSDNTVGGRDDPHDDSDFNVDAGDCRIDRDCERGETCQAGACVGRPNWCTADADCAEGHECLSNQCVPTQDCTEDGDCPSGQICDGGYCILVPTFEDDPESSSCTKDQVRQCDDGTTVVVAKCISGKLESTGLSCRSQGGDLAQGTINEKLTGLEPVKIGNKEFYLDQEFWTWTAVIVIAIATLLYIFVLRNPKIMKNAMKTRRKRK